MENIELVINMPEKLYKHILSMQLIIPGRSCGKTTLAEILAAIRRGIPLPKGHGDLKDADVMKNKLCTNEASEFFGSTTCAEILDFIDDEKPIIKADREAEE